MARNSGILVSTRHREYYIYSADLHVLADTTLFRVHGYFFQRESSAFNKRLNPASPGQVKEGTNDNDPVVLDGVAPEEFEKFLWVFYNPLYSLYDATVDDWHCILNLADKWDFPQVKELAVRELHKKPELDLIHKMALYNKYKVDRVHLVPLYAELCARPFPLSLRESETLGFEACVIINTARERLRTQPSEEGISPLPGHLEELDIYRVIEEQIGMDQGSTMEFKEETTFLSAHSPVNGEKRFPRGSLGKGRGNGHTKVR